MASSFVCMIHNNSWFSFCSLGSSHRNCCSYISSLYICISKSGQNKTLYTSIIYTIYKAKNIFVHLSSSKTPAMVPAPSSTRYPMRAELPLPSLSPSSLTRRKCFCQLALQKTRWGWWPFAAPPPEPRKYSLSRDQLPLFSSLLQTDTTLTPIRRQRNGIIILNV